MRTNTSAFYIFGSLKRTSLAHRSVQTVKKYFIGGKFRPSLTINKTSSLLSVLQSKTHLSEDITLMNISVVRSKFQDREHKK